MDENISPHGADVFGSHWNCHCDACDLRRNAVRRLVGSFSNLPSRWFEQLSDNQVPLPMWGWLFVVNELADAGNIEKLLRQIEEEDEESQSFAAAGWRQVDETGIYAIEFDDELILGIHGAGYDFYSHHWSPLYDALGYQWHTR